MQILREPDDHEISHVNLVASVALQAQQDNIQQGDSGQEGQLEWATWYKARRYMKITIVRMSITIKREKSNF